MSRQINVTKHKEVDNPRSLLSTSIYDSMEYDICCSSKLGLGPDCSILWPPGDVGDDKVLSINTSEWRALKQLKHPRSAMPAAKMCIIECHQVKWVKIKTFSFAVLAPNIECKYTSVTLSASGMQCTHRWRPFVSNGVWEFLMVINFLIHLVAM